MYKKSIMLLVLSILANVSESKHYLVSKVNICWFIGLEIMLIIEYNINTTKKNLQCF